MTAKNSLDALEAYKNTGTLDVQGLSKDGTTIQSGVAGTVTPSEVVIVDSNKDISSFRNVGITGTATIGTATVTTATVTTGTVTTLTSTTATVSGGLQQSFAAITAGTTQTQAGATAITTDIVQVTTGNASDGIILPALTAGQIGRTIRVINASANAGVIYCPGATSTNTIDGTAGATGVAYAASKMLTLVAVSATAWVSTLSN